MVKLNQIMSQKIGLIWFGFDIIFKLNKSNFYFTFNLNDFYLKIKPNSMINTSSYLYMCERNTHLPHHKGVLVVGWVNLALKVWWRKHHYLINVKYILI